MQLKIICIGDVVGAPGRHALRIALPQLVEQHNIDCIIVNAENIAAGSGITTTLYDKLLHHGVHLITLGDHIYRRKEIIPILEKADNIIKPANLPRTAPGKEYAVFQTPSGHNIAVISVLGRMYMKSPADCPFAAVDRVLDSLPSDVNIVVVDVHAEATSEKIAMGWHLDGRVAAVFGTHTHVPTADERVLTKGTAFITDLGMTGPYDSILGRDKENVMKAMIQGIPSPFDVASDDPRLSGIIVSVETETGLATAIERVSQKVTIEP